MRVDTDGKKLLKTKNYEIALFISIMIAVLGSYMGILGINDNNPYIIRLSFGYSLFMLVTAVITYFTKRPFVFYITGSILMLFLEVSFIFNGGSEGFGIIWLTIIPLFAVYIFDYWPFFLINGIYLIVLILFFWTPLQKYAYEFSPAFVKRFPIVYIVDFLFGAFLQYRIYTTEKALQNQRSLLDKEIQNARLIQKNFYPELTAPIEGWAISYKSKANAGVSGDLYDFFLKDNKLHGLGVFDISGHGISSGILTLLAKTIIQQEFFADEKCELWETTNRINDRFVEEKGEVSNYLTGIMLKIKDNNLEIVNAAHPSPILYHKSTNTFEFFKNHPNAVGPIGLKGLPSLYVSQNIKMESGDELLIYTDGIIECQNKSGELFGETRLLETMQKNIENNVETQRDELYQALKDFRGVAPATDDITFVILQKN